MGIVIGDRAPDFQALASNGERIKLSDFRGKYVVLYFYPRDMTPGCTKEACAFRDHYKEFTELDAVILGVSTDSLERHKKFVEQYGLPFLLIVDEDHAISEKYGVWKLKKNFGREYMGIERSTFIIDKEGKIIKEWRKVRVDGHVEEALQFIKQLAGGS